MQKKSTTLTIIIIIMIIINIILYNYFIHDNETDSVENNQPKTYLHNINLKKLQILRMYLNTDTLLSTDFIRDGLTGWTIEQGRVITTDLPLTLRVDHKPVWADNDFVISAAKALLLYNNESTVVVRKELPNNVCSSIGTISVSTAVLAAQKDGTGYPYVHNSFYYYKGSLGFVIKGTSNNQYYPLLIGKNIKSILLGEDVVKILSPYNTTRFNLKLYKVYLDNKYDYIFVFNGTFYSIKNDSYHILSNGPLTLYPGASLELVNLNRENIILIMEFSEKNYFLPGNLTILIKGDISDNIVTVPFIPSDNILFIPLNGYIEDLILNSTILVNIDSISVAQILNINNSIKLEKIYEEKVVLAGESEYTLDLSLFNGDLFLLYINDLVSYNIKYSSSDFLSFYGNLTFWGEIVGDVEGWMIIKSNIIYVPYGVERCGVEIIGYTYNGQPDEGSFVLYQKAYLYPFIVSSGYPDNPNTFSYHTIFYGGITRVDVFSYGVDRLQFNIKYEFSVIRTSIKGSRYNDPFPDVNELNISYGYFNWTTGPGCPEEDTDIGIAMLRPYFTRSSGPGGLPAGFADALGFASYSAYVSSIVSSVFSTVSQSTITTISVISVPGGAVSAVLGLAGSSAYTDDIVGTAPLGSECARYYGSYYLKDYRGSGGKVVGAVFSAYYQVSVPVDGGIAWGGVSVNDFYYGFDPDADNDAVFVLLYFVYIP